MPCLLLGGGLKSGCQLPVSDQKVLAAAPAPYYRHNQTERPVHRFPMNSDHLTVAVRASPVVRQVEH